METTVHVRLSSVMALRAIQAHFRYCFQEEEFERLTGRGAGSRAGQAALARLYAAGMVAPLARRSGFWVIVPPEYSDRGAPPPLWWLHDYLSKKESSYQLGLLSAAAAHGSSHFALADTQVFVPVPRRPLQVGAFRVRFFSKQHLAQAPVVSLRRDEFRAQVSSIATTLLDLLRHAQEVGGVERVALILKDLVLNLTRSDLVASLNAANDTSTAQRLGYLLDVSGHSAMANAVERWLRSRNTQRVRLCTSSAALNCEVEPRWKILVNSALDSVA